MVGATTTIVGEATTIVGEATTMVVGAATPLQVEGRNDTRQRRPEQYLRNKKE